MTVYFITGMVADREKLRITISVIMKALYFHSISQTLSLWLCGVIDHQPLEIHMLFLHLMFIQDSQI